MFIQYVENVSVMYYKTVNASGIRRFKKKIIAIGVMETANRINYLDFKTVWKGKFYTHKISALKRKSRKIILMVGNYENELIIINKESFNPQTN